MMTSQMAGRVAELHQRDLRAQVARDRQAERIGTGRPRVAADRLDALKVWLAREVRRSLLHRKLASA